MSTVGELLEKKGAQVHAVSPGATVLDATRQMNEHRVGAVVVLQEGRMVGIFTERDVLRRVVAEQQSPITTRVRDVMTQDVLCCDPSTTIDEASRIMRDRRVRHLPICDDAGRVQGLVSIGDINAFHADVQESTIRLLSDYVNAW
jgi:CBS domain-containing protein